MTTRLERNKIIFSSWFRAGGFKLNYLDIGARQDLVSPWKLVDRANLRVIGFEPDPAECARLEREFPERRYYRTALWSDRSHRPLYVNREPSTSSLYPHNEKLAPYFDDSHMRVRLPVKTVDVDCAPLDEVLEARDLPHYVKIDTQGAEFEIIRGAAKTFQRRAMFVSAETWTLDVYRGAPPFHAVAGLMWDLGYQLIDSDIAAGWHHRTAHGRGATLFGRRMLTGLELLFCKRDELLDEGSFGTPDDFIVYLAIAELFGFRDYALYLVERFPKLLPSDRRAFIEAELVRNSDADRSLFGRATAILDNLRGLSRGAFAFLR